MTNETNSTRKSSWLEFFRDLISKNKSRFIFKLYLAETRLRLFLLLTSFHGPIHFPVLFGSKLSTLSPISLCLYPFSLSLSRSAIWQRRQLGTILRPEIISIVVVVVVVDQPETNEVLS